MYGKYPFRIQVSIVLCDFFNRRATSCFGIKPSSCAEGVEFGVLAAGVFTGLTIDPLFKPLLCCRKPSANDRRIPPNVRQALHNVREINANLTSVAGGRPVHFSLTALKLGAERARVVLFSIRFCRHPFASGVTGFVFATLSTFDEVTHRIEIDPAFGIIENNGFFYGP